MPMQSLGLTWTFGKCINFGCIVLGSNNDSLLWLTGNEPEIVAVDPGIFVKVDID